MLYLSQVLSRPIRDLEGDRVATVKDVICRLGEEDHPALIGLVARYRRRDFFVSRWRITELNEQGVRLNSDILDLRPFVRRDGEVLLARNVLDKQLIDNYRELMGAHVNGRIYNFGAWLTAIVVTSLSLLLVLVTLFPSLFRS